MPIRGLAAGCHGGFPRVGVVAGLFVVSRLNRVMLKSIVLAQLVCVVVPVSVRHVVRRGDLLAGSNSKVFDIGEKLVIELRRTRNAGRKRPELR